MANSSSKKMASENDPRNAVVEALQRETANTIILYHNYKHYHWQTFGATMRDIHLMFDEFIDVVLDDIDNLAERVRMIGQDPLFRFEEIQKRATIQQSSAKKNMRAFIEEADQHTIKVIEGMRAGAKAAEDADDPGSNDLFSGMVRHYEKQEWFFRDILEKKDGLVA
jgi:starvation-inducible DNA-binding protein